MSKLSKQLGAFSDYYAAVRQVGHTTTVMNGALSAPSIVMTNNQQTANELSKDGIKALTIHGDLNKLRGMRLPMVFDNHALFVLFSQASVELNRLEMENIKLKCVSTLTDEANQVLKKEIENLKDKIFELEIKAERAKQILS